MHPFSLNQENTKEVTGGAQVVTTTLDETGELKAVTPVQTTMAIGEEGGLPVDPVM